MRTIAEYLQNNPVYYDFTDDCTDSANYQEKKGYEKYFIYRSPEPEGKERYPTADTVIKKNHHLYGKVGDPDIESTLLQNIYEILWPNIKEGRKEYMTNNNRICSDTMTSCQTILNNYVNNRMPDVLTKYGVKRASNKVCIELYETDPAFRDLLNKSEDLRHFVNVYHTLGNYIPVPYGFNKARSGYFGSHDSWDLTLMKIKEYYDDRSEIQSSSGGSFTSSEMKIKELLHGRGEIINCYKWLYSFGGWEDFIDKNFLQDFVGVDYQPIPFCKGHSWKCPRVQDHFDEFFRSAWQIIEKRSKRMIQEIEKILNHGEKGKDHCSDSAGY